jgi:hypothetical protein
VTSFHRLSAPCPKCGLQIPLEDTFGQWIRNCPDLLSQDGFTFMDRDLIVHRYKTGYGREVQCLMFVEIKTRGAELNESQRDTMGLISQLLRNRRTTPTKHNIYRQVNNTPVMLKSTKNNRMVRVKLLGYHLLEISGDSPENSKLHWDHKTITLVQLKQLLRCDMDPDTFAQLDLRPHHKQKQLLF